MKIYETELQTIKITNKLNGRILDIGGGGEGIIGRAFGKNVVSIDTRKDELDEAPSECMKLVMDAANLNFENESFDCAASFFTMMYIPKKQHKKVLQEIYRVLKSKAELTIWDSIIPENINNYDIFILQLKIHLPDEIVTTGYGVGYQEQSAEYYIKLLQEVGFIIESTEMHEKTFVITAKKP